MSSNKVNGIYAFVVVILALLLIAVTIGLGPFTTTHTGGGSGGSVPIGGESPIDDYAYVIYEDDDGSFAAKNGLTGTIDALEDTPQDAVNYAIEHAYIGGLITVLGDLNFTAPVKLTRCVDLDFRGNISVWHSDFLWIGDAGHWVPSASVWMNMVSGIDKTGNYTCLRMINSINVDIYFNDIWLFRYGILFDPQQYSIGAAGGSMGNFFYGGSIWDCDYGICWAWWTAEGQCCEGNYFFLLLYTCDVYGIYVPTGNIMGDLNYFFGNVDMAARFPAELNYWQPHGNATGIAIREEQGGWRFYCDYIDYTASVFGPGDTIMDQYATIIPVKTQKYENAELGIGLSGVNGTPEFCTPINEVPQYLSIHLAGTFDTDEQVTIMVMMRIYMGNPWQVQYGPILWKNFTATTTYELTQPELFGLGMNGLTPQKIWVAAYSNQADTEVAGGVTMYL